MCMLSMTRLSSLPAQCTSEGTSLKNSVSVEDGCDAESCSRAEESDWYFKSSRCVDSLAIFGGDTLSWGIWEGELLYECDAWRTAEGPVNLVLAGRAGVRDIGPCVPVRVRWSVDAAFSRLAFCVVERIFFLSFHRI